MEWKLSPQTRKNRHRRFKRSATSLKWPNPRHKPLWLISKAILGNHRWQSQQTRLELGLCLSDWFQWANDLDCRRASRRRKALRCACRWKADCVCGIGKSGLYPPIDWTNLAKWKSLRGQLGIGTISRLLVGFEHD